MDSAVAALWTLVGTILASLIAAAATLGPIYIQRQRLKLENELELLKQRASDKAVLATEDQTRGQPVHGVDKVAMAVRMAGETSKSVTVNNVDVRAAVSRMKASLPATSITPLPIPVTVVSSEPPAGEERTTNPIPPAARVPAEWSAATSQAAGLQPRKP